MTGGLAFEGLNNAGMENTDLLVILNDNNIAIDPNTGALKEYLVDITTSKTYNKMKERGLAAFRKNKQDSAPCARLCQKTGERAEIHPDAPEQFV